MLFTGYQELKILVHLEKKHDGEGRMGNCGKEEGSILDEQGGHNLICAKPTGWCQMKGLVSS